MQKDELVHRAQGYAISKLDLEAAERELKVAQDRVNARREDHKKASGHLCCHPLQLRTTTVLLEHPHEKEGQVVVIVQHSKHERDGDLWDVQMVEVTAR
jgi:hypothetical protein